ncbi:MAG: hypothetical protein H7835_20505, partial [Magnetococcus sp. XQGC-1]
MNGMASHIQKIIILIKHTKIIVQKIRHQQIHTHSLNKRKSKLKNFVIHKPGGGGGGGGGGGCGAGAQAPSHSLTPQAPNEAPS